MSSSSCDFGIGDHECSYGAYRPTYPYLARDGPRHPPRYNHGLVDQVRLLGTSTFLSTTFPVTHSPIQGYPSSPTPLLCTHPPSRSYDNSIASTSPHPGFTTDSVPYFMGRSIGNAPQSSKGTILCGSLTIWTRYLTSLPFPPFTQTSVGS